MKDFRTLNVWEKGHKMTLAIYRETKQFPKEEVFGLTSQMRRAASSIGANIAEGCGRDSPAEFKRFLVIAHSSAKELEYHILLARDLDMLSVPRDDELQRQVNEVQRMLWSLIGKIRAGDHAAAA